MNLTGKRVVVTGASSDTAKAPPWLSSLGAKTSWTRWHSGPPPTAARRSRCRVTCPDLDAVDDLVKTVEDRLGGVDMLVNNAGRSIRRPLAESLDRWHDVERDDDAELLLAAAARPGLAHGMLQRGDGHIINVATWGVFSEASPLFAVYNASKAALSSVSRVIETEWSSRDVQSTTLYYPLVATPMIAPTRNTRDCPR